jgi:hypothetical protein
MLHWLIELARLVNFYADWSSFTPRSDKILGIRIIVPALPPQATSPHATYPQATSPQATSP